MKEIQKVVELLKLNQPTPKSMDEARQKHYQFWDTQPVPKLGNILSGIYIFVSCHCISLSLFCICILKLRTTLFKSYSVGL